MSRRSSRSRTVVNKRAAFSLLPLFTSTSLTAEADGAELLGLTVQLDLSELGLTGEAILTDIQTTPRIEAPVDSRDERQVVTATFHHSSGDVIDLVVENPNDQSQMTNEVVDIGEGNKGNGGVLDSRLRGNDELAESGEPKAEIAGREFEISDFKSPPCDFPKTENLKLNTSGEAETIGTTSNHPFWSEDRQEFVQAGSLEIGERLQTLSGDVKVVQQKLPRPGPQPVFNLEVHDEHVYFVGEDGVLVHNAKNYDDYADAYLSVTARTKYTRGDILAAIEAKHGVRLSADELTELRHHMRDSLGVNRTQSASSVIPGYTGNGTIANLDNWAVGGTRYLDVTGVSYSSHFAKLDEAYGAAPNGFTWHHHHTKNGFQLIPTPIHNLSKPHLGVELWPYQ